MGYVAPSEHTLLELLAGIEPWRLGRLPLQKDEELCKGEVDWELGTAWWMCPRCGHIGSAPYHGHFHARVPLTRKAPTKGLVKLVATIAVVAFAILIAQARKR